MDALRTSGGAEARLHFLDYWRIIRIRKAVIILVFILISGTATFVTLLMPKTYASHARIRVEHDTTDIPSLTQQSSAGFYDPYFIQTEFEVIRSQTILDKVIADKDLNLNQKFTDKLHATTKLTTPETRKVLRDMIDLSAVRNTSLIDIFVYDEDANEAALIAQKIAEVYQQYRKDEWEANMNRGIESYEKEVRDYDQQVIETNMLVQKLRVELMVDDSNPQDTGPSPSLGQLAVAQYQQQQIEAELKAAQYKEQLTQLKALSPEQRVQALPEINPDSNLQLLLQEKIEAESKLASLMVDMDTNNPQVQTALALIHTNQQQINEKADGILNALQTELDDANAQVKAVEDKLAKAKEIDRETIQRTAPYWEAKSSLNQVKKFRELLLMKVEQEKANSELPKTGLVKIIDKAEPNLDPVRPKNTLNIALGIVIGLVVGFGLAFFIEYLDTSVKTIDDVERTLQSPVLGVIPQNVGYLLDEGAESPHAEAYRVLRTNLLFSRKDDKLNTVAVVSAGAGEGKSTTVCNLATVFAQGGQRVLMVDSDLRRPTLHRLLQVANTLGLTNYLLKQNTLEEVIQTTKLPTLDFMASGKLPSSSLGVLNSAQMRDLITELKKRYDYVFFDSPPIMGVSDASILASEVDMTLQVIQYRRYPQPMNIRAKHLIEKVGGNLVGIVLNNINMAQDESYYYYSGYYHEYYGKNDEDSDAAANGAAKDKSRINLKPKS